MPHINLLVALAPIRISVIEPGTAVREIFPPESARDGITIAQGLGHLPSLAHALWFAGCIHLLRRDVPSVLDCGERLLMLGGEHGLEFYQSIGGILHGWSLIQLGHTPEG